MLPRSVIIPTTQQCRPSDSSSALPLRTIKHWAMWIQVQCRWPRMSVEASQHHQGKLTPLRLKTSSCLSSAEGNLQQMWLQTAELPAGLGPWIRPILRLPLWPLSHCLSPPSRQENNKASLVARPCFYSLPKLSRSADWNIAYFDCPLVKEARGPLNTCSLTVL